MRLPPAVTIHGLAQARVALAAGHEVTLLSAVGAGVYAGTGWWLALMAAACVERPLCPHILDCGTAPGRALEAARAGQTLVILRSDAAILAEAQAIAASYGTTILDCRPPSLDLGRDGAGRFLTGWLAGTGGTGA